YSEVYTDHTTGTNADPLKYTVSPSSGIPTVTGISPASPTANSATQQLTIGGSGFQAGAVVKLSTNGGTFSLGSGQVQFFSATQLQIQTILASAGLWQLQVITASATASTPFQFTVQPSGSTVSGAAITPATPTASTSAQTLFLVGSGFKQGLSVGLANNGSTFTISGPQIISVSNSQIQFTATLGNPGSWTATVTNSDSTTSNAFGFTVSGTIPGSPVISSISPSSPPVSAGNQTVTVNGSGFQTGLTVSATFPGGSSILSGAQIQSVMPTSFQMIVTLAQAGLYTIRVNNPGGSVSNTLSFTAASSSPSVSSINPATPGVNGSNQTVTVNGSQFQNGLTVSVTFPGGGGSILSGSQIQNVTSTSFQMVILLGLTGSYTIRVNNPDGGTSNVFSFNVAGPAISSVSPNPVTGSNTAQPFTINGSGFVSGDTVTLRDKTAGQIFTNRTISSLTSNQIVINPNFTTAAHTWSVEVLNSLGGSSGEFIFQVVSPPLSNPQITSISPATPTANGSNQTVTVDGSQFQSGLTVSVTFPGGSSTLSG